MAGEDLFLSSQHSGSKRWAILDDDGSSAWLYLTKPNSQEPAGDAFVYNRIPPITFDEVRRYRGGPPPIAEGFASVEAVLPEPNESDFRFQWSADGESAAVLLSGRPISCIMIAQKQGYSVNVAVDGPWGKRWDADRYALEFGAAA